MLSSATFMNLLSNAVTYIVILMLNVLMAVRYFNATYPETARLITMLLAAYILFKCFMRIVRFWWGVFKFSVKVTLLFIAALLALGAYYRGPQRFFMKDLPLVYRIYQKLRQKQREALNNLPAAQEILGNPILDSAVEKNSALGWLSGNAAQLNGENQNFAENNVNYIQDFVKKNVLKTLLNAG
ncbi:hypothetical protein METBIDRAFT_31992 [Metschnikowia bicuspidata var. bicuspidata NRRL YB-4993]|uniref:Uncharacterized protein n=1 Tax=Metschnikowia bicuspidata var. bicuspidata NRRL YB-4993 TaxID=869754 RepID=A0A1A0HBW6_9ASCO|nr:hypothetical protein METBIDRAFT_31992 [Metschnikowia bicuspidata var. bicuspidata NRRL YB-4993]OBA21475.1 hypothetical protein METBIDRAFT_31992 [Metschnikowia bicuspidata var. bicuspidata NRRL YB-4993]